MAFHGACFDARDEAVADRSLLRLKAAVSASQNLQLFPAVLVTLSMLGASAPRTIRQMQRHLRLALFPFRARATARPRGPDQDRTRR